MAGSNGSNGHVEADVAVTAPKLPTIEELRRAYEEGLPQTLLSGLEVRLRPVQPDRLLMSGKVPEILTPLVLGMMFAKEQDAGEAIFHDEIEDPVAHFLAQDRKRAAEAVAFVAAIDIVCEAALVEPDIVPYLSIADRMWIFRLAWLPVDVLRNFRLQPQRDVETGDDSTGEPQQAEQPVAVDSAA